MQLPINVPQRMANLIDVNSRTRITCATRSMSLFGRVGALLRKSAWTDLDYERARSVARVLATVWISLHLYELIPLAAYAIEAPAAAPGTDVNVEALRSAQLVAFRQRYALMSGGVMVAAETLFGVVPLLLWITLSWRKQNLSVRESLRGGFAAVALLSAVFHLALKWLPKFSGFRDRWFYVAGELLNVGDVPMVLYAEAIGAFAFLGFACLDWDLAINSTSKWVRLINVAFWAAFGLVTLELFSRLSFGVRFIGW